MSYLFQNFFFKWWKLKVKSFPFPFQCVCFFLSLEAVLMMLLCIQSILLCFHDIHMHLKPMRTSYIVLFLIYVTGFIYWFFFCNLLFFPLICLSSIHFNYWMYFFVWMYLPSPSLGIFRLFSNLRYYRYCWNEIHDHDSLCSVGKAL